jgi:uncharacterized protein
MLRVLDSWAILAWLQDERPAAQKVQKLLDDAEAGALQLCMSIVNVGEVYYRLAKAHGEEEAGAFFRDVKIMPLKILSVPNGLVLEAAKLKGRYPISYADAFVAATAIREKGRVVTGDPDFKQFIGSGIVEVEWLGV